MRGDAPHYVAVSHSIIHDFDLDLRNQYDPDAEPFFNTGDSANTVTAGRSGRLYPRPAIGLPIVLLPAYVAAEAIAAVLPESLLSAARWNRAIALRDLLSLAMAVLYAWTAVLTLRLTKRIRPDGRAATVATIVAFLTPPLLSMSFLVFPEIPAAFLGVWFVSEQLRADPRRHRRMIPLALLPWLDLRYAAISLIGLAWVLREERQEQRDVRSLAATMALPFTSVAAYILLSAWMFGSSLGFGPGQQIALAVAGAIRGSVGLLLDGDFGLLVLAPFWVFAIAGVPELRRDSPRYAAFASLAFLATWGSAAFSAEWWGGYSPPARHLVPVLPLLVPMLAAGFARLAAGAGRWLVYAGVAWAAMVSSVLVTTPINLWTDPINSRGLLEVMRSNQPTFPTLSANGGAPGPGAARTLARARARGNQENARLLEAAGVDIEAANDWGETALVLAARAGNADELELLLGGGADPNATANTGETALMEAAASGDAEIVSILIGAGADLDAIDRDGWTALLAAAHAGHNEIVLALIEAGADVDRASELGWTPLLSAAYDGHLELVTALVAAGADVNISSSGGKTALIRAAQRGHLEIVRTLLGAGADATHSVGGDALTWARLGGHDEVVAELQGWTRDG